MALVVLGSRRVTRDFDFVIAHPGDRLSQTVGLLYDRGLELVSGLNQAGDVVSTISERAMADIRLRVDAPASAFFYNAKTGLRIDLLFDFPVAAAELAKRATRTKVRSQMFAIASEKDLLHLKRIAKAARSAPGDAEDNHRDNASESSAVEGDLLEDATELGGARLARPHSAR
jgi:hypothetical protein